MSCKATFESIIKYRDYRFIAKTRHFVY